MIFDVPVDPNREEARQWLARELAKPAYREAEPNWFDTVVTDFLDWLASLIDGASGGPPALLLIIIVLVIVGLIVAAYFIFGPPRLNRRSRTAGTLFGDDDSRDAATIRRAAEKAAAAEDWALAIEEMFRAIARGLSERSVLSMFPGTTATGFAAEATEYFPDLDGRLAASGAAFDDVRYLDRPGTEEAYRRVAELERTIRDRKPVLERVDG